MNIEKLTIKSREVLQSASLLAKNSGQQAIEPAHLMLAIVQADDQTVKYILSQFNVSSTTLIADLQNVISRLPRVSGGEPYLSSSCNSVLSTAESIAQQLGDSYITIDSLFLAVYQTDGSVRSLLQSRGISQELLTACIQKVRQGKRADSPTAENAYQALSRYAICLTDLAKENKLDPVIGRDSEIRRTLQILSRRTKNNPILIGQPGTGKTAIVEGLAQRIISGDVPENLQHKRVFSLDMGSLIAGAKYQGEFEERLKSVIKEVTDGDQDIILFIDEIHTLVGAGKSNGAMDAANILKPALARGELRAIGATTLEEYQKYFETDKALERRFQTVMVDEPDEDSAIAILRGIKSKYEAHHHVRIKDDAVLAAVRLSERYISDRFLPDKAIDLIDEAASKLRIEMDSVPQELDEINRHITQLEIEKLAIQRDGEANELKQVENEIAQLQEKQRDVKAQWERERNLLQAVQQCKSDGEQLRDQAKTFERNGDYERVAEIRYSLLPKNDEKLKQLLQQLQDEHNGQRLLKEEVDADDIAEVVSRWTGIPVNKMLTSESYKLLHLEEELHKRVVGQDRAITAIADAVRRSRAGLNDPRRPIGSFIFLGTTGVGKTELAKALADYLFNDENLLTRIDMSEYQEKFSVSRLIGPPPGYVGYDEGGQLTEAVRRKPYSVVLFDEIEKAHPDVFNILLQVLDDGRLTDNKGRTVNFKNTIIIMTSNLGSDIIRQQYSHLNESNAQAIQDKVQTEVFELLKNTIRPEFLNRIDELIMFEPLNRSQINAIVTLQLQDVARRLTANGVTFTYTPAAVELISKQAYDAEFGARPVKRKIQQSVLNQMSKDLLAGTLNRERPINLDIQNDELIFTND